MDAVPAAPQPLSSSKTSGGDAAREKVLRMVIPTKICLLADALGRPLRFGPTGGRAHQSRTAEAIWTASRVVPSSRQAYGRNAIRATVKATRRFKGRVCSARRIGHYRVQEQGATEAVCPTR
jgi:hypothetical protein